MRTATAKVMGTFGQCGHRLRDAGFVFGRFMELVPFGGAAGAAALPERYLDVTA